MTGKSLDITNDRLEKLKGLLPETVAEGKDNEVLKVSRKLYYGEIKC